MPDEELYAKVVESIGQREIYRSVTKYFKTLQICHKILMRNKKFTDKYKIHGGLPFLGRIRRNDNPHTHTAAPAPAPLRLSRGTLWLARREREVSAARRRSPTLCTKKKYGPPPSRKILRSESRVRFSKPPHSDLLLPSWTCADRRVGQRNKAGRAWMLRRLIQQTNSQLLTSSCTHPTFPLPCRRVLPFPHLPTPTRHHSRPRYDLVGTMRA